MEQEPKHKERSFIRELVPDWRPTREQVVWTVRIVIGIVFLLGILTLIGLPFNVALWEWVKRLIVPAVIAAGGLWFNRQQQERSERQAEQRAQDEALEAYLDDMTELLVEHRLRSRHLEETEDAEDVREVARARTLTVLARLDAKRKRSVLQFLEEAQLIEATNPLYINESGLLERRGAIVMLMQADLSTAHLSGTDLSNANLNRANLSRADLKWANLSNTDLRDSNLSGADLSDAEIQGADLSSADLSEAKKLFCNSSRSRLPEPSWSVF